MEDGVADPLVFVAAVHINLLGRRAGPHAVHFQVGFAPIAGDPLDDATQVIACSGVGHVQACAAPGGIVWLPVVAFDEPVLVVS